MGNRGGAGHQRGVVLPTDAARTAGSRAGAHLDHENTNARIADISRAIKALACELQVPVIVAAQLNRNAAQQDKEPMIHELRDSGSIEQDADIVLLLHALDGLNSDRDERKLMLFLAKQRNGPLIKTKLLLRCSQMRFVQLPPDA